MQTADPISKEWEFSLYLYIATTSGDDERIRFKNEKVNEPTSKSLIFCRIAIVVRIDDGVSPKFVTIDCIYIPTKSPFSSGKTTVNAILEEMSTWETPFMDIETKQIRAACERISWQIALLKGLQTDMICDPYPIILSTPNTLKEFIIPQYLDPKLSFGTFVKDSLRVLLEDEPLLFKALQKHFPTHIRKDYNPPDKRKV